MTVKVLGRVTSINVRKVLWALDELGVGYEREEWGIPLRDPRAPEFLALNPNGLVPVLVEGDFVLWESNAIARYLAARHHGLLPRDLQTRALVDQWVSWQGGELSVHWSYAVNALLRRNPAFADEKRIAESLAQWTRRLDILEAHLRDRTFMVGEAFSIADIVIGVSSHRWYSTPVEGRKAYPAIEAHYRQMQARPAGGRWLTADTP